MKPERAVEIAITVISALILMNAVCDEYLGASGFLPAEYYSVSLILAATWLVCLIFVPRRMVSK